MENSPIPNGGRNLERDCLLGFVRIYPQVRLKSHSMKFSEMFWNMGWQLSVKKHGAPTSMIVGGKGLRHSWSPENNVPEHVNSVRLEPIEGLLLSTLKNLKIWLKL
tara:strand:- start:632 stop:949 length:318 start_codon:yes stop_codon:yes gene_type:complete